jgi:ElaB/YqjD/DUF883 family membrane-anchored ribosome-binding protein
MSVATSGKSTMLNGGLEEVKSSFTDTLEDGVRSARRAVKHGRYAVEDLIEEAQHAVKQKPLEAVGIAFTAGILAGALAGGVMTWFGLRRH